MSRDHNVYNHIGDGARISGPVIQTGGIFRPPARLDEMKEFQVNGWTIRLCPTSDNGFDLIHGEERYHHDHLEMAVITAQRSPRSTP